MNLILEVPGGTQSHDYDCGAKCLQLIMQYHNVSVAYPSLLSRVQDDKENGVSINKIKSLARSYGFKARSAVNCRIRGLEERISNRQPVMVLIQAWAHKNLKPNEWRNMGKGSRDYGHYAIVMGFDDDFIILRDPNIPRRIRMTKAEFVARWHGGNDRCCAIMLEKD
jgi:ABC-type bacteriocin/lantibiotic exporter with double-glycine peptidase domain